MQKAAFLILFLCSSFFLFSQKTVDTNWGNGTLKTRVKLVGKDTSLFELFRENGTLGYKRWGNDSFGIYLKPTQPLFKVFLKRGQKFVYQGLQAIGESDSVVVFGSEGNPQAILVKNDKTRVTYQFRHEKIAETITVTPFDSTCVRVEKKDANGTVRSVQIMDTSKNNLKKGVFTTDSFFFRNGNLRLIGIKNRNFLYSEIWGYDSLNHQTFYYKEDTNRIKKAKDNSECLYGFTDYKDEWVIKPQYEDIQALGYLSNYYLACNAGKCTILNVKGKPLFPLQYDFLELLQESNVGDETRNRMSRIYRRINSMDDFYDLDGMDEIERIKKIDTELDELQFKCRQGKKYGVINGKGGVIIEPQYDNIRKNYNGLYEVQIGKKWGIVNQKGDVIVKPNYYSVDFTYTPQYFIVEDTFSIVEDSAYMHNEERQGLVDANGNELLPVNFRINLVDTTEPKYYVTTRGKFGYNSDNVTMGIYNADQKRWVLDTIYNQKGSPSKYEPLQMFEKTDPISKSVVGVGILDNFGNVVLPFEYDNLEAYQEQDDKFSELYGNTVEIRKEEFLITKKKGLYGLYNLTNKTWAMLPVHEHIATLNLQNNNYGNLELSLRKKVKNEVDDVLTTLQFLSTNFEGLAVKKGNKWNITNAKNKNLLNDTYDYVASSISFAASDNPIEKAQTPYIALVKDNKTQFVTQASFPLLSSYKEIFSKNKNNLHRMTILDGGQIVMDKNAAILMTPQYQTIYETKDYIIAFDTILKKQRIIYSDGKVKAFLPQYTIKEAQLDKNYVIVEDRKTKQLGLVMPDGKSMMPCTYFSLVPSEDKNMIWAKQDAPKIPTDSTVNLNNFELTAIDSAWLLFDKKGKLLQKTPFQYPFMFHNGVGAGMVNQKFGIWNSDGKMLLPPTYDRIVLDTSEQIFYLFKQWADSSLAVGFADMSGKVRYEPRLDKMSPFFGNYALAFTSGHHTLINKQGDFVVPPLQNSFLNYKGSAFDSLWLINKAFIDKYVTRKDETDDISTEGINKEDYINENNLPFITPIERYERRRIDSLGAETRKTVLNFLIQKASVVYYIEPKRILYQKTDNQYHFVSSFDKNIFNNYAFMYDNIENNSMEVARMNNRTELKGNENRKLVDFSATDKYVNIVIKGEKDTVKRKMPEGREFDMFVEKVIFYTLTKGENGWENVELSDILNINRDNSLLINELLNQKIKTLKNENIDCSNPTVYFERSKDQFFVEEKGIEFYLPRQMGDNYYGNSWNHVPLLLTWEELKPFLKKKL
jgi:WG containing repeat